MSDLIDPDIEMFRRPVTAPHMYDIASVSYFSVRGNNHQRGRSGNVTSYSTDAEGRLERVEFHDDDYERHIRVILGERVGDSTVMSKKPGPDSNWQTLGPAVRVTSHEGVDNAGEAASRSFAAEWRRDYGHVVAVANVNWNGRIIEGLADDDDVDLNEWGHPTRPVD